MLILILMIGIARASEQAFEVKSFEIQAQSGSDKLIQDYLIEFHFTEMIFELPSLKVTLEGEQMQFLDG